jgi:hypothetical protein
MNENSDFTKGLCVAALIAIPLWGALWFGAVYAVGIFMIEGG